jgi:hypothetical protein
MKTYMDCLIQRLNEITARLIAEEKVLKRDDRTVLACHGKLNGLETLFFGTVPHADGPRDRALRNRSAGNGSNTADSDNDLQLTPRPSSSEQRPICHGENIPEQDQQELLRRISRASHELRNRFEEMKVWTTHFPA